VAQDPATQEVRELFDFPLLRFMQTPSNR